MALPTEEEIKLILKLGGFDSIDKAIESFDALRDAEGKLEDQQEKAVKALEYYRDVTSDAGSVAGKMADVQLEQARSQAIVNEMLAEGKTQMAEAKLAAEGLAGEGGGEGGGEGTGGFSKLASGSLKAQRGFEALLTGKGLGRAGSILESVTSGLGMASGVGFAVASLTMAFEHGIPALEKFFGGMDPEKLEKAAGHLKSMAESAERIRNAQTPGESETAGEIGKLLKGGHAGEVVGGSIQQLLRQRADTTATPEEEEFRNSVTTEGGYTAAIAMHPQLFWAAMRSRANMDETVKGQSNKLLADLAKGDPAAMAQVSQMAIDHPGMFPAGFAEQIHQTTPEARRQRAADEAYAQQMSDEAEAKDKAREAMRKEQEKTTAKNQRLQQKSDKQHEKIKSENERLFNRGIESTMRGDEAFNKKLEQDRIRADHQDAIAQRQAETKAARDARQNTPEAQLRRAEQEDKDALLNRINAVDLNNQQWGTGIAASPEFKGEILRRAERFRAQNQSVYDAVQSALNAYDEAIDRVNSGEQNRPRSAQLGGSRY